MLYAPETFAGIVVPVGDELEKTKLATVAWEGDSLEVLKSFPSPSSRTWDLNFGNYSKAETNRLPIAAFHRPGVFELRDQDERAWYRLVYLSRIRNVIYVLHCFEKKTREMPRRDFEIARQRFKGIKARLAEEKKREKHS